MAEQAGQDTISTELEQSCAQEPIHIIGTVQPHGFLVVVDIESLRIVQVSSGIARHWKGLDQASRLLQAPVADWVEGFGAAPEALLSTLPGTDPMALPLQPRSVAGESVEPAGGAASPRSVAEEDVVGAGVERRVQFECVGHQVGGFAVLEWQPADVSGNVSVEAHSLAVMTTVLLRLRTAKALEAFFRDCVREVAQLCGFDRVMLYRFLPDWTGEVIAEEAAGELKTRFLGLRFPASDIPSQARALYANSKIRVLADVLDVPDTLLPERLPDGAPLDQSHSLLRGFSDVHRSYLKNMGVRATMSLSVVCDGKLWGLIACHHYRPRTPPHHVRNTLRHVCELVAVVSGMRIENLARLGSAHDAVALDKLLVSVHQAVLQEDDTKTVLTRMLPQLLSAFKASALCVRIAELNFVGGAVRSTASEPEILHEVASLFTVPAPPTGVVQLCDLLSPSGAALVTLPEVSGVLAVQQAGDPLEICAFTRPEVVREVHWAGAPTKQVVTAPNGRVRLEPRRSFDEWKERIAGTSRAWSPVDVEACGRLLRILSDACKRKLHKTLERELQWRAHHDHLTGLYNRRSVEERLDQRMGASRYDTAVMLIDLDHFKTINDGHGHAAGDRLLQDFSKRLSAVIRPSDILSRVGGDEFLLLADMPLPDHPAAVAIAARLHKAMETPFEVGGQLVRLGLSVGIAIPPGHGNNATDLMRRADLALYRAKKSGRASTVIFDAELEEGLLGTYELERDLRDAVRRNQLSLAFQPEVDLHSGRVVALEALARWTHPKLGSIGPSTFIPIAERSDLISQIGDWVVRTALSTQAEWRLQGRRELPIAVNVSMTEVTSGKLVEHIGRLLSEFRVPADCLTVELTESVIMKDPRLAMSVLTALRQLGISTALDDFGTGYSSLSYLRQLPLTGLKVDQSFTAELTRDAHSRSLTQAIIRMAEALNMTTIAEGVETVGQLEWLRGHGCRTGQGYLFSHPVAADVVHPTVERIEAEWPRLQ